MKINSDKFLGIFNTTEKHLRQITGIYNEKIPFSDVLAQAVKKDSAVRSLEIELKEFRDLRNAIVHERTDSHVIAEPHDEAVARFEQIMTAIIQPPKIRKYMVHRVTTFQLDQPIGTAVHQMYEKGFSQAPIYEGSQFVDLLTTNAIARWLGKNVANEVFSVEETTIGEVLNYTEDNRHVSFMSPDTSVYKVFEHINRKEAKGIRTEAILITHSGKKTEELLGIITIWDLPKLHQAIDI